MAETSRDDQKLWLILFQIKAIRARLNSLALQRGLFWTLAFMIAGAARVVGAAMDLRPLPFLILALALVLLALAGSLVAIRSAWRTRTSPVRAAAIADQRGDLKGRLATVQGLALAGRASTLWPYLIEDTYGARQQFEPSHIEPRWFSRAGWALLGAMALAALLIPGSLFERNRQAAMMQAGGCPAPVPSPPTSTISISARPIRPWRPTPGFTPIPPLSPGSASVSPGNQPLMAAPSANWLIRPAASPMRSSAKSPEPIRQTSRL